jgi:hypothetical protein
MVDLLPTRGICLAAGGILKWQQYKMEVTLLIVSLFISLHISLSYEAELEQSVKVSSKKGLICNTSKVLENNAII